MGEIINSKILYNGNLNLRVLLDENEAKALKNAINNVFIFSENLFLNEANIIERGNKKSTKYFDIPFSLRFRKKKDYNEISYIKLENHTKTFYIYVVNKKLL